MNRILINPRIRIPTGACARAGSRALRERAASRRNYSAAAGDGPKVLTVDTARAHGLKVISEQDRSSYILHKYIPRRAQDAFLAIRLFNLDTARIGGSVTHADIAKLRFDFWRRTVQQIFTVAAQYRESGKSSVMTGALAQEPIAILLAHALTVQGMDLSKRFFVTLLQSRETYAKMPPFRNVDAMASYGEGTHSQTLYLAQEACYSAAPKVTQFLAQYPDIDDLAHNLVAHVGQAAGIASLVKGFSYYGRRGAVVLPVDAMARHGVSQHDATQLLAALDAGGSAAVATPDMLALRARLSDVVFETATRANDHIISAGAIVKQLDEYLSGDIPDAIFVPAMNVVPTKLFLERLEKYNFDILHPDVLKPGSDWKLPYRSYKAYKLRKFE